MLFEFRKFMNIVGVKKRSSLKRNKGKKKRIKQNCFQLFSVLATSLHLNDVVDWSLSWPVCRRVSQSAAWWEYCWPLCWRAAGHNRSSRTCPKFDRWFGWLVRCSAGRLLAGRVVARWFGWSVRWSVGPLIGQWVGKLVVWLVARSINRLVDWWVTGLVGRLVDHTAVKRLRMCGQCIELVACFQTFRTNLSRSRKLLQISINVSIIFSLSTRQQLFLIFPLIFCAGNWRQNCYLAYAWRVTVVLCPL